MLYTVEYFYGKENKYHVHKCFLPPTLENYFWKKKCNSYSRENLKSQTMNLILLISYVNTIIWTIDCDANTEASNAC